MSKADNVRDRLPLGRAESIDCRELAADLVRRQVDVIVATVARPSRPLRQATTTIPIVFAIVDDPVRHRSCHQPRAAGRQPDRLQSFDFELAAKRLELLQRAGARSVPRRPCSSIRPIRYPKQLLRRQSEAAARAMGCKSQVVNASTEPRHRCGFRSLRARAERTALFVGSDPFFVFQRDQIVDLAARHALPAIYCARASSPEPAA